MVETTIQIRRTKTDTDTGFPLGAAKPTYRS
jgi:hypothetical protein